MICKPSTLTLDEFHLRRCDSLAPVNQSQAREGLAHGSTWCPVCEHMPCSSSRTRKKKIISAGNAVTLRLALPALRSASSAWRFRSITACARNRGHSGHEERGDAHATTTGSNRQHRTFISSFAFFPVFACKGVAPPQTYTHTPTRCVLRRFGQTRLCGLARRHYGLRAGQRHGNHYLPEIVQDVAHVFTGRLRRHHKTHILPRRK